jgi:unsaturated chondroitin disaccharide hydrolase
MFNQREALDKVLAKLERTSSRIGDSVPYRTTNGVYDDLTGEIDWWTNGFWPGILWLAYRETKNEKYLKLANGVEDKLDKALQEFYGLHHDVGFMWHISSVTNYKLTGNENSARRGYIAASVLASRFNPAGPFIRAWNGWNNEENTGWAIIDCMMNLPILYWASEHMKDPRFYNIAVAHAETVMNHFIREDGSVKHICKFDPVTGEYVENYGGQGYSPESSWSRGTAWALYGFALSSKYTGRKCFTDTAKRIANFFISHLPEDHIPFADFKAPAEVNIYKDSSAGAIAASGLLLLSRLVEDNERDCYYSAAKKIVASLYNNYTDWEGDEALIIKGNVAFHLKDTNQLETSLIYGDYYFLEALQQLNGTQELF